MRSKPMPEWIHGQRPPRPNVEERLLIRKLELERKLKAKRQEQLEKEMMVAKG